MISDSCAQGEFEDQRQPQLILPRILTKSI